MTTSHTAAPTEAKQVLHGNAREQLQHLYRAIGISAVAAAAAQVSRGEAAPIKPKHELPAFLRDDDDYLAA